VDGTEASRIAVVPEVKLAAAFESPHAGQDEPEIDGVPVQVIVVGSAFTIAVSRS